VSDEWIAEQTTRREKVVSVVFPFWYLIHAAGVIIAFIIGLGK
jgi:hypothetical protein